MADTPEQQIHEMAEAIAIALDHLRAVARLLPIPIDLPIPGTDTPPKEFVGSIERMRTLVESEPITEDLKAHLDQATLCILTAIDIIQIALAEGIEWRYEAVHMICTTAVVASSLTAAILERHER
ncbi:hypothetical protein [Nonomuraea sp. CA-141351]|uniref:hypothetical protein n=1 Tax=Nonomuraea sp. CA-141351 TaxID=3239996 RepID=UPI003D8F61C3